MSDSPAPELIFHRGDQASVKMACMYCGAPATHTHERRVTNPRLDAPSRSGAGGNVSLGDDPISGCIALVLLPLVLYGLWGDLRAGWRHRAACRVAPPLDPPDTLVTTTTCDRHRHYARRFTRAVLTVCAACALLWVGVVLLRHQPGGAPLWLVVGALVGTLAAPLIFVVVYDAVGPVRVSKVTRDSVTMGGVRSAYFDAPG
ncbi:hypothetical protein R5W23_002556 [Gemmata sp. JC673]|uniref:Uncharacterized protein n=1 Tax=Gemmata algarum TaxID=2975278 RepID=A0ABU5F198_9BACT|nr:hypothetical protein [Gemmata algarum]MDY3561279.1 hypothetical protein [Gemmata algarum]